MYCFNYAYSGALPSDLKALSVTYSTLMGVLASIDVASLQRWLALAPDFAPVF